MVVKKGDITKEKVDAIVNPANSYGLMGGGLALALKKAGGSVIEEEAMKNAPIPIGSAILTSAGLLNSKHIIHSPTMTNPAEQVGVDNVRTSVKAALECAVENHLSTIAFPGMGTGVGGVNKDSAAKAMMEEATAFIGRDKSLDEIIFVGFDDELYDCFVKWQKNLNPETE